MTSAFSPFQLLSIVPYFLISCLPSSDSRSSLTRFVTHRQGGTFLISTRIFVNRNPTGAFILHGIQISPDNDKNFRYAKASFTVSPVPGLTHVVLTYPEDSALYDISVRRPTSLHLDLLQTLPHGNALAIS